MTSQPIKIAIASGKGGTGKTLLSTNLASFLGEKYPTLLVDLDVEEPNDSLFIQGELVAEHVEHKMIPEWDEKRCTLCGECTQNCKFHAVVQMGTFIAVFNELCHSCYACSELCPAGALPMKPHKMGTIRELSNRQIRFVESRLEIGEEQAVPLIHKTHELVDSRYKNIRYQLFDSPPGTSCPMVAATEKAHFVILITEPTPFGLHDLKLAVETTRKLNNPFGVVINRDGLGNNSVEQYCKEENIPILARIPFDKKIAEYYSRGELAFDKIDTLNDALGQLVQTIEQINPTE